MYKKMLLAVMVMVACSGQQCLDSDLDGVPNGSDNCANTPLCAVVDAHGCPSDDDGDGVYNGCDQCEDTPTGETVYANGCATTGDGVPPSCQQMDPRAKEIEYSLVSRTSESAGTILVKGVVDNFGLADYLSSPGQQSVQLWADSSMIVEVPFEDLAVGETVTIEHERIWDANSELPAAVHYMLLVTYDPDIFDDGNPNNDDCQLGNNLILRSTHGIDALFD